MNRQILRLSIPAILNNITVPLLGLCDTAIAGHLGNTVFLGAMAVGAMMLNIIYWLFGFLRMGTTGMTALAFGAANKKETALILCRALTISILISAVILLLRIPLLRLLLLLVAPESYISETASTYFLICVAGLPAQFIIMSVTGWFIGMQTTLIPMIIALTVNIINILLNIVLAFPCGLGFEGIAYATLTANWIGALLSVIFVLKKNPSIFTGISLKEITAKKHLTRFFAVNSDLFLRSACVMSVSLTMTAVGARLGNIILATNAVLMQFFVFFSYFMDGFAFCGEALTGKYAGEGNIKMLRKSVKYLLIWSAGIATSFLLIYLSASRSIITLLTDDLAVVDYAATISPWIYALPVVTVLAFIYDGFFIGLTLTRRMLIVTFISVAIFYLITFVHPESDSLFSLPDNRILWTAFEVYLFLRGFLLMLQTGKMYQCAERYRNIKRVP